MVKFMSRQIMALQKATEKLKQFYLWKMSEASTVEEQLPAFIDVPTKFPIFIVNKNIT